MKKNEPVTCRVVLHCLCGERIASVLFYKNLTDHPGVLKGDQIILCEQCGKKFRLVPSNLFSSEKMEPPYLKIRLSPTQTVNAQLIE